MSTMLSYSPAHARRAVTEVRRAALVAPRGALARALTVAAIDRAIVGTESTTAEELRSALTAAAVETLVYLPRWSAPPDLLPDLDDARLVLDAAVAAGATHVVILSSTAVYGATHHHAGLATEWRTTPSSGQAIAQGWLKLEALAASLFAPHQLTILRAAPCPIRGEADFYSRLLTSRRAATVIGYDPTIQLLSVRDLASAVGLAVQQCPGGTFNIVPASPVPLSVALEEAGARRVRLPWTM